MAAQKPAPHRAMGLRRRKCDFAWSSVLLVNWFATRGSGIVHGFPINALRIPNGRAFPALGHRRVTGGGPLSEFGEDFLKCEGTWAECLCRLDSDNDGETNGLELGDPCCEWRFNSERQILPRRTRMLSNPSDSSSVTNFSLEAIDCSAPFSPGEGVLRGSKNWDNHFDEQTVRSTQPSDGISRLLELVTVALFVRLLTLAEQNWRAKQLQRQQSLGKSKKLQSNIPFWFIAILAYLWGDLGSAISHVVLDNPEIIRRWPLLKDCASSFQEHHINPKVLSAPPLYFLLPMIACTLREPQLYIFSILACFFFVFAYIGHMYSHAAQGWDFFLFDLILLSRSHHHVHHTTFASNFAFLSGWTDPLVNSILLILPQAYAGTWLFGLGGLWSVLPRLVASFTRSAWWITQKNRLVIYIPFILLLLTYFGQIQQNRHDYTVAALTSAVGQEVATLSVQETSEQLSSRLYDDLLQDTLSEDMGLSPAKQYSAITIAAHNQASDGWLVLGQDVLDVTDWIKFHPGGQEVMLPYLGFNATLVFLEQGHSDVAEETTRLYKIGQVAPGETVPEPEIKMDVLTDASGDALGLKRPIFLQPIQGEPCFGPPHQLAGVPGGRWHLDTVIPFLEKYARGRGSTFGIVHSSELAMRLSIDLALLTPDLLESTPNNAFYIRTGLPGTLNPTQLSREAWKFELRRSTDEVLRVYTAQEIHEAGSVMGTGVMECSGNTRTWHFGLLSQAQWTRGIRLRDFLKPYVDKMGAAASTKDILVEGYDDHLRTAGGTKGASWVFTWEQVVETGMFLATELNGQPLPPDHGFPIRLVVPNWYGCTCIKWLRLIKFVDSHRVKPTGQMFEFRTRVHMQSASSTTAYGWHAKQGLSATATRAELWRHLPSNSTYLKFVGLFWGGQADAVNPLMDIDLQSASKSLLEPVQVIKPRSRITEWSTLCHAIPLDTKLLKGSKFTVTFRPRDPNILAPRLRSKTRSTPAWYTRMFQL